jgi:hypothetical protein
VYHDNNNLSNTPLVNDNFFIQDDLVQELCTESNHAENNLVKRNNLVFSDCKVAPAERNVAKKFKQAYSKDLTKQIDVTAPQMLRSKKVIEPRSHEQAISTISNNAEQTPEAWLAVNYLKDLE